MSGAQTSPAQSTKGEFVMLKPAASVPLLVLERFVAAVRDDLGRGFRGAAIGADDSGPAVWLFVDDIGLQATLNVHGRQGEIEDAEHVVLNVWVRELQGRDVAELVPDDFRRIA